MIKHIKKLKTLKISKIEKKEDTPPEDEVRADENLKEKVKATRNDLQISRRLFHMSTGVGIATAYIFTFSHNQVIHILGIIACLIYLFEQIRVSYPKLAKKFIFISKYLLRAEEQLKESAALPYTIAIFLTILTFPKTISIASIFTLALADPSSALIGIKFGRHQIVKGKSIQGSLAFFFATVIAISSAFFLLGIFTNKAIIATFFTAFVVTLIEMIPSKIDDNLIIPLTTAFILWASCFLIGVPLI